MTMILSQNAVRALMLAATGLDARPDSPAEKLDVLATISRMAVLQIDTIHIVARSPYLVLWSRLGSYQQRWLDELLADGALFEYWSHAACFLPIEYYPLYRSQMLHGQDRLRKYAHEWLAEHRALADHLLGHIRENGPVRSSDFERTDGQKGTWWNWKIEKQALEILLISGELMISRRHNFQRIYDVREQVLPSWDDAQIPTVAEVQRILALRAVQALGVAPARWIADYFRMSGSATPKIVRQLAAEGQLLTVEVEGWNEPGYVHPDNQVLAEKAAAGLIQPHLTTLLSPFDPLVWHRARASELFGFDYLIECYTPAPKRRYGYFTLPILRRGQLVGRLDPKAHRKEGLFEVKALHLEPGINPDEQLATDIAGTLRDCANWHATPDIVVRWADPPEFAELVRRALDG
ncbi:MAG: crosslink repair DNA glycosylase YcaQ family protein [Roseiflexaceae bacterium]|nr:crosslink repair DNA glycosylase YcaQ family protein [Roseiflexaceae bacterium]